CATQLVAKLTFSSCWAWAATHPSASTANAAARTSPAIIRILPSRSATIGERPPLGEAGQGDWAAARDTAPNPRQTSNHRDEKSWKNSLTLSRAGRDQWVSGQPSPSSPRVMVGVTPPFPRAGPIGPPSYPTGRAIPFSVDSLQCAATQWRRIRLSGDLHEKRS